MCFCRPLEDEITVGNDDGGLSGLSTSMSMPHFKFEDTHAIIGSMVSSSGEKVLRRADLQPLYGRSPFPTSTVNIVLYVFQALCVNKNKELKELETRTKLLTVYNDELNTLNNDLTIANANLSSEVSRLENKVTSMSIQHSDERYRRLMLEEDVDQAKDTVNDLNHKLEDARKFIKALIEVDMHRPVLKRANESIKDYCDDPEEALADAMFYAFRMSGSAWSRIGEKFIRKVDTLNKTHRSPSSFYSPRAEDTTYVGGDDSEEELGLEQVIESFKRGEIPVAKRGSAASTPRTPDAPMFAKICDENAFTRDLVKIEPLVVTAIEPRTPTSPFINLSLNEKVENFSEVNNADHGHMASVHDTRSCPSSAAFVPSYGSEKSQSPPSTPKKAKDTKAKSRSSPMKAPVTPPPSVQPRRRSSQTNSWVSPVRPKTPFGAAISAPRMPTAPKKKVAFSSPTRYSFSSVSTEGSIEDPNGSSSLDLPLKRSSDIKCPSPTRKGVKPMAPSSMRPSSPPSPTRSKASARVSKASPVKKAVLQAVDTGVTSSKSATKPVSSIKGKGKENVGLGLRLEQEKDVEHEKTNAVNYHNKEDVVDGAVDMKANIAMKAQEVVVAPAPSPSPSPTSAPTTTAHLAVFAEFAVNPNLLQVPSRSSRRRGVYMMEKTGLAPSTKENDINANVPSNLASVPIVLSDELGLEQAPAQSLVQTPIPWYYYTPPKSEKKEIESISHTLLSPLATSSSSLSLPHTWSAAHKAKSRETTVIPVKAEVELFDVPVPRASQDERSMSARYAIEDNCCTAQEGQASDSRAYREVCEIKAPMPRRPQQAFQFSPRLSYPTPIPKYDPLMSANPSPYPIPTIPLPPTPPLRVAFKDGQVLDITNGSYVLDSHNSMDELQIEAIANTFSDSDLGSLEESDDDEEEEESESEGIQGHIDKQEGESMVPMPTAMDAVRQERIWQEVRIHVVKELEHERMKGSFGKRGLDNILASFKAHDRVEADDIFGTGMDVGGTEDVFTSGAQNGRDCSSSPPPPMKLMAWGTPDNKMSPSSSCASMAIINESSSLVATILEPTAKDKKATTNTSRLPKVSGFARRMGRAIGHGKSITTDGKGKGKNPIGNDKNKKASTAVSGPDTHKKIQTNLKTPQQKTESSCDQCPVSPRSLASLEAQSWVALGSEVSPHPKPSGPVPSRPAGSISGPGPSSLPKPIGNTSTHRRGSLPATTATSADSGTASSTTALTSGKSAVNGVSSARASTSSGFPPSVNSHRKSGSMSGPVAAADGSGILPRSPPVSAASIEPKLSMGRSLFRRLSNMPGSNRKRSSSAATTSSSLPTSPVIVTMFDAPVPLGTSYTAPRPSQIPSRTRNDTPPVSPLPPSFQSPSPEVLAAISARRHGLSNDPEFDDYASGPTVAKHVSTSASAHSPPKRSPLSQNVINRPVSTASRDSRRSSVKMKVPAPALAPPSTLANRRVSSSQSQAQSQDRESAPSLLSIHPDTIVHVTKPTTHLRVLKKSAVAQTVDKLGVKPSPKPPPSARASQVPRPSGSSAPERRRSPPVAASWR